MGGHLEACDHCGAVRYHYHSCRNRHCPQCHGQARARWLEARREELLATNYFHLVFTLPDKLRPLVFVNRRQLYGLLLRAAGRTLVEIAADPRHLGATPGVLAVLHTWGGALWFHPHAHLVVTGGGLSADRSRWIACRGGRRFFLPHQVLARKFRGKFLAGLRALHAAGKLAWPPELSYLADPRRFRVWLKPLYRRAWHVFAKPPFGSTERALKYLARYSHGVALSNRRLVSLRNGRVTFRYKNYRQGGVLETLTLDGVEFLRRFLQHVLPPGFTRIRYFGLLANRQRATLLPRCREVLGQVSPDPVPTIQKDDSPDEPPPPRCPKCRVGTLQVLACWPRPSLQQLLDSPLDGPWLPPPVVVRSSPSRGPPAGGVS